MVPLRRNATNGHNRWSSCGAGSSLADSPICRVKDSKLICPWYIRPGAAHPGTRYRSGMHGFVAREGQHANHYRPYFVPRIQGEIRNGHKQSWILLHLDSSTPRIRVSSHHIFIQWWRTTSVSMLHTVFWTYIVRDRSDYVPTLCSCKPLLRIRLQLFPSLVVSCPLLVLPCLLFRGHLFRNNQPDGDEDGGHVV